MELEQDFPSDLEFPFQNETLPLPPTTVLCPSFSSGWLPWGIIQLLSWIFHFVYYTTAVLNLSLCIYILVVHFTSCRYFPFTHSHFLIFCSKNNRKRKQNRKMNKWYKQAIHREKNQISSSGEGVLKFILTKRIIN